MEKKSHYSGLSDAEVLASREQNGVNVLTPASKVSVWSQLMAKFKEPLIIILMVAGAFSIAISCYEYYGLNEGPTVFFEPAGIFMAIILATGLSFYFEQKAEKEFNLLNTVNDDEPVQVVRNGGSTQVPRRDIVVGDIVVLNTGDEVPADGVLVESVNLSADESSLTGEPLAMKTTDPERFDKDATFPSNHVLRGTKVMEGHGVMKVTEVGDRTENGKVFESARIDNSVKTPLNEQLERLGVLISRFAYAVAVLIIVGRVVMYFVSGPFVLLDFIQYLLTTIMISVAIICVAVPEGLPMAITLSLAYSMRRMLKTNNLVRKMHASETMGATTVICTDKTGTLTENQMRVAKFDIFGEPEPGVIEEGIAVNSTALLDLTDPEKPSVLGNPTEGALLLWMKSRGIDFEKLRNGVERVEELPFSTERKYMATVIRRSDGRTILYVKGAPEIVFGLCKNTAGLTRKELDAALLVYQNQAMRTLGFAYADVTPGESVISDNHVVADNLTFLAITAISDPVRATVPGAVREVLDAGIEVKIVTGDTPGTAKEIGRQIGLWDDSRDGDRNIITGDQFALLSDEQLRERAGDMKIIARARPLDKKRLVEALQANGEVVAVTGDGTNDAPALKAAHVGLSMGDGTSVAKEASDITIVDNSFTSIGRAVMWGRSLYRNIQRFILFQLTVNVAACLIVMCGAFMGTESPLTVTQMLWVNLIMDTFAAVALASLPPSANVMKEKPRRRTAFIINRPMWRSILTTGLIFFAVLLGLLYYFGHTNLTSLTQFGKLPLTGSHDMNPQELSLFFTIFVFLQFWNMFNARAFESGRSAFHFKGCGGFLFVALIILVGQYVIVTFGGAFFGVVSLTLADWLIILVATSPVLWIGEIARLLNRRRKV